MLQVKQVSLMCLLICLTSMASGGCCSFVQMQQRAAAKEQDIMQQASKLRAYCQKLENLKVWPAH